MNEPLRTTMPLNPGQLVGVCPGGQHVAPVDNKTRRIVTHPTAPMLRDVCAGVGRFSKRDMAPPGDLIKISPNKDLYVVWGMYTQVPVYLVDRRDALDLWCGATRVVDEADQYGASGDFCGWRQPTIQVGFEGIIAREHLEAFAAAWLDDHKDVARQLLLQSAPEETPHA